jgi:predicted ArsR family transcriptional regulator
MIRSAGVRRGPGAGKPSTVYELPPEAEMVFSRAYPPVLGALLEELVRQLPSEQMEAILLETGRRLAEPLGTGRAAASRLRRGSEALTRDQLRNRRGSMPYRRTL